MSPTHSIWQELHAPIACDVAIVGRGIMGCATAYWLRQQALSLNVTIVQARQLASAASGRNAGFLLVGTHTNYASAVEDLGRARAQRLWRVMEENTRMVSELEGSVFELQLTGRVIAAGDEAEAQRLEQSAVLLQEDGGSATHLTAEATNEMLSSKRS